MHSRACQSDLSRYMMDSIIVVGEALEKMMIKEYAVTHD